MHSLLRFESENLAAGGGETIRVNQQCKIVDEITYTANKIA